jgi:aspartate aminotransferase/aminotransferase
MRLARRTNQIDSSGIRKVFNLAQKMTNPINLSIGQPDFDVADPIKEAAIEAIRGGNNRYTVTAGLPQLREKVLEKYKGRGFNADDSIITSGVSGALVLSFLVLLDPDDEIIMADPYFVMYKHLANFIGAKPVFIDTYPDFRLKPEDIEDNLTERTKVLIVNSPNNPTGIVYTAEELKAIADIASRHDLLVITDDIYDHFYYGDETAVSPTIASVYPNTLMMGGLSKSAAMTGWRLGYALGPKEIIQAMTELQQYSFVCAPSFAQHAALKALDCDMEQARQAYRHKRDLIYEGIADLYNVRRPDGAFYIFPEAPNRDGDAFVAEAIHNNLLVVPGSVFSEKSTHFRISFAASEETIEKGVEVLRKLAKKYH